MRVPNTIRCHHFRVSLNFILLSAAFWISLSACAVREQAFNCNGLTAGAHSDEFLITPTSLRFQSKEYSFVEERLTLRVYTSHESGQTLEFEPLTGTLRKGSDAWACKRIQGSIFDPREAMRYT